MNIVLATDDNFVQHCCVTITSILVNNKDLHIYIFTEGLSEHNEELLNKQVSDFGGELTICKVDSSIVGKFPMPSFMSNHISIATYYRLFSAEILPESVDRAIYLDCDIVVKGSLEPMWNIGIDNYALAAVYQSHQHSEDSYERLCIPKEDGYFNAGVLLMNIKYWRDNNVSERLLDFVRDNYSIIHAHDQDVLNATLHSETKVLDYIWNYRECFFDGGKYDYPAKVDYSEDGIPVIIHFVSKPKPWNYYCKHPLRKEYYSYLAMTPFKGYKPLPNYKDFVEFVVTPFVVKYDKFQLRHIFTRKLFKSLK